jgi:MFS family permease
MSSADIPPPTAGAEKRSSRSAMMIVFLVVFIDLLGFGIVLPLLPRIAEAYAERIVPRPSISMLDNQGRPETSALAGLVVGLLMSSFSLMQFVFAPIWGRLSDRIGRRPILLIGLLGSVVFYTLFGFACTLAPEQHAVLAMALFFGARIGAGVSGATIATAQAVIADCTPPDKRKHGMALIGAAFGIGFTFGPLIGFGCMSFNPEKAELIGYSAAVMSFVALALGVWLLPETRVATAVAGDNAGFKEGMPPDRPAQDPMLRRHWLDWSATKQVLANAAIWPVILTFFIASLGFGAFEVTLALFLKDNFGFDERNSFLIFAYVGFVLMLTQGFLYRRLASRVSEVAFMGMGILFMGLGVALMGFITHRVGSGFEPGAWIQAVLYVALTAAVVGFAFLTPSAQALISRRTPADRQGEVLGVNQSASAMARILGPVVGVTLYKATETHLLPYIVGAILLGLMLPMLPRIRRGAD